MSTGLMVTIGIFILAGIFGLILRADSKRTAKVPKTEKPDTALKSPVSVSAGKVETQPESWKKSAERFRRKSNDS